jgi:hypothetical protein
LDPINRQLAATHYQSQTTRITTKEYSASMGALRVT